MNRSTALTVPTADGSVDVNDFGGTPSSKPVLPDTPLVAIRPTGNWRPLDLRDLWAYRELFLFLTWRDIKIRYKQTALGVAWALIQPLATMFVFTLFFGRLAGMPSNGLPYPVFVFAGLLPWTFFANAVTAGSNSLINNANLITKVYFPRMLIPAAAVGVNIVDFGIASVMMAGLLFHYRITITWAALWLPVPVVLIAMLALGVSMWTAALNVKYRDVRHAMPFVVQIWMFVSPIIFPASIVPAKWRFLLALNPVTGIVEGFRSSLFGLPFDWVSLGLSALISCSLLVCAAHYFRSTEKRIADIV